MVSGKVALGMNYAGKCFKIPTPAREKLARGIGKRLMLTAEGDTNAASGLTTGQTAFIEEAQQSRRFFIEQPYALYSERNHETWTSLYARMTLLWEQHANEPFLRGLDALCLNPSRVPRLEDVNKFLMPLTGFQAKAVSGFLPAFLFFDCLRNREFPTTITVRDPDQSFAPWPDIFHDICGHVPMHTDPAFADVLVRFGNCAHLAVERVAGLADEDEQRARLSSIIRAMARFFWFTVESGLMNSPDGAKVYGSALLSSHGEIERCLDASRVQRHPFQLEWVINQCFLPNFYQPLLFAVDSFDHLFNEVGRLEQWLRQGKLDFVAPGEPNISEEDLDSFLRPERSK